MPSADPLVAIVGDLAALGRSERQAILAAFKGRDRARLKTMLDLRQTGVSATKASSHGHSTWFEEVFTAARNSKGHGACMTEAVRRAILDAADGYRDRTMTTSSGRSLLQTASDFVGQARRR